MEDSVPSGSSDRSTGQAARKRRVSFGIIAQGRVAVGIVAMGGLSIGVVALGGVAIGVVALGGVAVGGMALGGLTFGWRAVGALAFGIAATQAGVRWVVYACLPGLPRLRDQATAQHRLAARKPS